MFSTEIHYFKQIKNIFFKKKCENGANRQTRKNMVLLRTEFVLRSKMQI